MAATAALLMEPSWGVSRDLAGLRQVIDDLMHRNRMTYAELARKTGIAQSTVHKISRGENRHMPKAEHLDRIALALGVAPRVLHEAAAESYGIQVAAGDPSPGADRVLIDNIVKLDERRKAMLAEIVEGFLAATIEDDKD